MRIPNTIDTTGSPAGHFVSISGPHRRTLEAIFRHPLALNLEWCDVVALITDVGDVHTKANREFVFEVAGGQRHVMRKPDTKNLTSSDMIELHHFLMGAGFSPELSTHSVAHPGPSFPSLLIVMNRHETTIFDVASARASEHTIRPNGSHRFLRHVLHNHQLRQDEQRAPDDAAFYEVIANAITSSDSIVMIVHGRGAGNAAHHLVEYLKAHHCGTCLRIVEDLAADLSYITIPQLLDLAQRALRS